MGCFVLCGQHFGQHFHPPLSGLFCFCYLQRRSYNAAPSSICRSGLIGVASISASSRQLNGFWAIAQKSLLGGFAHPLTSAITHSIIVQRINFITCLTSIFYRLYVLFSAFILLRTFARLVRKKQASDKANDGNNNAVDFYCHSPVSICFDSRFARNGVCFAHRLFSMPLAALS